MPHTNWQVITHWVSSSGTEFVQVAEFDSHDAARREIQRLAPTVGDLTNGRLLKSLQILGDFSVLSGPGRSPPAAVYR